MPGGDRTGPRGMGPMTGRAAGFCAGYATPGFMNMPGGYGFGGGEYGRGGRGRRNRFYATGMTGWQRAAAGEPALGAAPAGYQPSMSKDQELEVLRQQAQILEQQMKQLQQRISQLSAEEVSQ